MGIVANVALTLFHRIVEDLPLKTVVAVKTQIGGAFVQVARSLREVDLVTCAAVCGSHRLVEVFFREEFLMPVPGVPLSSGEKGPQQDCHKYCQSYPSREHPGMLITPALSVSTGSRGKRAGVRKQGAAEAEARSQKLENKN